MILYHGTHKTNVSKIQQQGIKGHPDRFGDPEGFTFLTDRPDIAFDYAGMFGGEINYSKADGPNVVPDEDRALFVFNIPDSWCQYHLAINSLDLLMSEISFDTDVPPQFITDLIIGDREKVYNLLKM